VHRLVFRTKLVVSEIGSVSELLRLFRNTRRCVQRSGTHKILNVNLISWSYQCFINSFINGSTVLLLGPGLFFSFVIIFKQSIEPLGQGISPSQGRYIHTGQHKQNKYTQTSMPWVRFELTIPVFEWARRVHASDRAATMIVC
jgi:hypothetical protein